MRHAWWCVMAAAIVAAGCQTAGVSFAEPPMGDVKIVASPSGDIVPFEQLVTQLDGKQVVYVGEGHNNDYHHAFQYHVVRALYDRDDRLMIGMEMFQRPFQAPLDKFLAGEIGEFEFLKQTEYFTRWKWDWRYYRPILLFARENRIPVVALNVPAEASRKVARGGLASLTDEERKWVAKDVDLGIKAHQEFVQSVWNSHPMGGMMKFENFYASQCLWEDTMAESVANALAQKPGYRMVVIVGAGHVRERFGIPMRADKRGAAPSAVLCGEELETGKLPALTELLAANVADWLYFTEPAPETPPSPKLGVSLAQGEEAGTGEGLLVKEVTAGGAAAAAGVAAGDRIVGISGKPVATLEDLQIRLAIMDGVAGTVDVLRGAERKSLPFTTVKVAP